MNVFISLSILFGVYLFVKLYAEDPSIFPIDIEAGVDIFASIIYLLLAIIVAPPFYIAGFILGLIELIKTTIKK